MVGGMRTKGTLLFIAHQMPKELDIDELVTLGTHGTRMGRVTQEQKNA